jgi:monoamine oxidase
MVDVIVIGAGFAGCAAAREVRRAGREPLILEARDRIGGRTWTDDWDGQRFELGGNFFHWFQPHAWTEITAAGCTPVPLPDSDRVRWNVGEEIRMGSRAERDAINERAWNAYNADSWEILPQPHAPLLHPDRIARLDGMTIRERIDELDLTDDERALLIVEAEGVASGHIDDAGAFSVLRWHALSGHTLPGAQEACGYYTIGEGTIAFLQPILDAAACEVRLSTPVAAVEQEGDHVVVTTRDGEAIAARAVVVTAPLNTLGAITFAPGLSETKQGGIALGQAGIGSKVMIKVRGGDGDLISAMHPDHPFGYIGTIFDLGEEQIVVGFGHDGSEIEEDLGWVQSQLDRAAPGYEVIGMRWHDWKADEFSRGTWAVHRPGWYTTYHAEMQRPEGRVVLANSDFADGWAGFVDGALESGKRGGRIAAGMAVA